MWPRLKVVMEKQIKDCGYHTEYVSVILIHVTLHRSDKLNLIHPPINHLSTPRSRT